MPTFQHSELLPEHEISNTKIPAATEEANQCSDPDEKQAAHGLGLYQIKDWKYCCKLLILRSARVLARDNSRAFAHFHRLSFAFSFAPDVRPYMKDVMIHFVAQTPRPRPEHLGLEALKRRFGAPARLGYFLPTNPTLSMNRIPFPPAHPPQFPP